MQIQRTFNVAAPRERVWQFITSPEQVGPCMPGCRHVEITGPGAYKAVIHVKVGPIKTTFNFNIETVEERAPDFAAFATRGEEGGSSSRVSAESTLSLRAVDTGNTEVTYTSKIAVVGRLGKFAGGVMHKMAESMSDEFVAAFRARVEPAAQPAAAEMQPSAGIVAAVAQFLRRLAAQLLNLFRRPRQR